MKVYCGNCKHMMRDENGIDDECRANPAFRDFYFARLPGYSQARNKNHANDCPEWQPNRRYRLRRWLAALCCVAVDMYALLSGER